MWLPLHISYFLDCIVRIEKWGNPGRTLKYFFFVTHQMNRNHILNKCIPELRALNNGTLEGIIWQQDGAAVHRKPEVI